MLAADKDALRRELRLNMLQLQWKELEFLHRNFVNLTVTSSVLVGFGVASFQISNTYKPTDIASDDYLTIWELDDYHWMSWYFVTQLVADALFSTTASLGLAYNLLCLFISTLSVMCGPGMALRGQEGSVAISVRHLESMLKRALRFFGRGILAFTFSMVTIGMRQFHTIAAFGGVVSIVVGLLCIYGLWSYGCDMAEKFYVSPNRAVRGTFVHTASGIPEWKNTTAEVADDSLVRPGIWICGVEIGRSTRRWRPEGHGVTTALWRADKLIAFPYHDEERLQMKLAMRSGGTLSDAHNAVSVDATAKREQQQLNHLLLNAQGATGPVGESGEAASEVPMTFEALNPWQAMNLVGQALTGGADTNNYSGGGASTASARPTRSGGGGGRGGGSAREYR